MLLTPSRLSPSKGRPSGSGSRLTRPRAQTRRSLLVFPERDVAPELEPPLRSRDGARSEGAARVGAGAPRRARALLRRRPRSREAARSGRTLAVADAERAFRASKGRRRRRALARAEAMRDVGRALAFAPENAAALALFGRLGRRAALTSSPWTPRPSSRARPPSRERRAAKNGSRRLRGDAAGVLVRGRARHPAVAPRRAAHVACSRRRCRAPRATRASRVAKPPAVSGAGCRSRLRPLGGGDALARLRILLLRRARRSRRRSASPSPSTFAGAPGSRSSARAPSPRSSPRPRRRSVSCRRRSRSKPDRWSFGRR